jgi:hypothetical protein
MRSMKHWGILAILGAASALSVTACGGGPPPETVHGQVAPSSAVANVFSGVTANSYAQCSEATPAPGTQVTVTNPSGKVLGSAVLGLWSHQHITTSGITAYQCDMPFTIRDVPHEARYGFAINGVPGKIWVTKLSGGVTLSVSSS